MLRFVRVLAFAELVAGCAWLWPALFPQELDMAETVRQFAEGYRELQEPPIVSPLMGLSLIGMGTLSLAITCRSTPAAAGRAHPTPPSE